MATAMNQQNFLNRGLLVVAMLAIALAVGTENGFAATVDNPMTKDLDGGGYKVSNVIDVIAKGPWVDVRAYTSFSAAIDAIGSSNKTLLIPSSRNVTADKTVPSNVTLKFLQGGKLNIANNTTVTINGLVDTGPYRIFRGNGSVSFGTGAIEKAFPEWWGAVGDGTTNSSTAIQSAIDSTSVGSSVYISEGATFLLDSGLTITKSMNISGKGTLKASSTLLASEDSVIFIKRTSDVEISGITINGNNGGLVAPSHPRLGHSGIAVDASDKIRIYRVKIKDSYKHGISFNGDCRYFEISNNTIENSGRQGILLHWDNKGGILRRPRRGIVSKNIVLGGVHDISRGIYTSAIDSVIISENIFVDNPWGGILLYVGDFGPGCNNNRVVNNTIISSLTAKVQTGIRLDGCGATATTRKAYGANANTIANNTIRFNGVGNGIEVKNDCRWNKIVNNSVQGAKISIFVDDRLGNSFYNNYVGNSSKNAVKDGFLIGGGRSTILANTADSSGGSGFNIVSNDNKIIGNYSVGNTAYGFHNNGRPNNVYRDNFVIDNSSGNYAGREALAVE